MCTSLSFHAAHHLFGRNLDLEYRYNEAVVVTPRHFSLFDSKEHPALIGTATVFEGYPLYYDAMNEHGLCAAALNFTHSAVYHKPNKEKVNVPHYNVIAKILSVCKNTHEAKRFCQNLNITDEPFDDSLPVSKLHWMVADKYGCFVIESEVDGLNVKENPIGVLTNEPPFEYHLQNLKKYINLSPVSKDKNMWGGFEICSDSRGMGAVGLPGDCSSESRFVRAAFGLANSYRPEDDTETVTQFFHLLGSVEFVSGLVRIDGKIDRTQYSSCYDTETLSYYYKTYDDMRIHTLGLCECDIDSSRLIQHPLSFTAHFDHINRKP